MSNGSPAPCGAFVVLDVFIRQQLRDAMMEALLVLLLKVLWDVVWYLIRRKLDRKD